MSSNEELPLSRRVAEALVLTAVLTGAYLFAGTSVAPQVAPMEHVLDGMIPFVPETVWMYLPGYWSCFLVTIWVVRDARQFRAAMTGLATLTFVALPIFLDWPVAAPRPAPPPDPTLTAAAVRWLYQHDPVGNTFPSLHVANATFCAVVTTAQRRGWGAVTCVLAASVAASVLTLHQHWVVDVPAGWALATVGAAAWRAQLALGARGVSPAGRVALRPDIRARERPIPDAAEDAAP